MDVTLRELFGVPLDNAHAPLENPAGEPRFCLLLLTPHTHFDLLAFDGLRLHSKTGQESNDGTPD